jgi:HicB family
MIAAFRDAAEDDEPVTALGGLGGAPPRVVCDNDGGLTSAVGARFPQANLALDLVPEWCHTGAMELEPHVDRLREQLAIAAEAGGEEARALAQRLAAPLDAGIRLMLLDALEIATAEITRELAPGSVELRLRGGDPEFVVTPAQADRAGAAPAGMPDASEGFAGPSSAAVTTGSGEGGVARINLRLPEQLKTRVEEAADREGLSINTWLVRAAATAVDRAEGGARGERGTPRGGQQYTGWGR